MKVRLVVLLFSWSLYACNTSWAINTRYDILEQWPLPDALAESSGLYCDQQGQTFSINDSGNPPVIYQIDTKAIISAQYPLKVKNKDWEALAGDDNYFYVGDIGNNNGQRTRLNIYKVAKKDLGQGDITSLDVSYVANQPGLNETLNHDFDGEALVVVNDHLVLFSKSWQTDLLKVYLLDKSKLKQHVKPYVTVSNLPGVITGATYDPVTKQYILVGYPSKRVGFGEPFMVILSDEFVLLEHFQLTGYGQVEAVCQQASGEIWFTQEGSIFSSAKLVKIRLRN
ncbi:MAG: hypothetical protein ACJA13_002797 [Paraglaciecola sp.]|jgi:hypothetical protein